MLWPSPLEDIPRGNEVSQTIVRIDACHIFFKLMILNALSYFYK